MLSTISLTSEVSIHLIILRASSWRC